MAGWWQDNGTVAAVTTLAGAVGATFGWIFKARVESKKATTEDNNSICAHEETFRRTLMDMIRGLEDRLNEQADQLADALLQVNMSNTLHQKCQQRLSAVEAELDQIRRQHTRDHGS